jgi:hypothetical protein
MAIIPAKTRQLIDWGADKRLTPGGLGSLRAALRAGGYPWVPQVDTPLQEAQVLLRAGAEVEHALLVEYLYAAWSSTSDAIRARVLTVAIQEMSHLVTVQNLLLFTGAKPYLGRQDQNPITSVDPFPFSLRPFSKSVLEDFLLAEMPPLDDLSANDQATMQKIIAARSGSGTPVNRVGLIYSRVYWLLQQDDRATADWPEVASAGFTPGFHIGSFPGEASAGTFQVDALQETVWQAQHDRGGIFARIDSRTAALHAVSAIAAQGEGLTSSGDLQSHFETFLNIYTTTDFAGQPVSSWPTDPSPSPAATRPLEAITDKVAVALNLVFDARYRILLGCLKNALSRDRSDAAESAVRHKYVTWAFEEMLSSIKALANGLARRPCKAGGSVIELRAAPSFALESFQLADDSAALDQTLLDEHKRATELLTAALAAGPDAGTKFSLQQMLRNDKKRFPNAL